MSDNHSLPIKTTQDQFLSAFFSLLEHHSYEEIKIVDICREANLSRKTFYTYFKHKEDILDYLAQIISLCYSATDDKSGHYHYFNFFYHMQHSVALLLKNNLWYDISKRVTKQYTDLLYPRDWKQILGTQLDKKNLFLEFMSYGSARLIEIWCENRFQETPEELCALVEQIQSSSPYAQKNQTKTPD